MPQLLNAVLLQNLACVALKLLVSLFGCLIVRGGRERGTRQTYRHTHTHRPSIVSLTAHVRRGLMKITEAAHTCKMSIRSHPWRYIHLQLIIICSSHNSPSHVCWDLLPSQVTLSQCHDDHLHWHSGEQSSGTVMNSRVPMNINEHLL